jgi:hypothetical protein
VHTQADDWEFFFQVLSWVVLRFTKHGLNSAKLTHELQSTCDDSYISSGKFYGGENNEASIKSRFISSNGRILPSPLLDLLKDVVDVLVVRYDDPPPGEEEEEYALLQTLARDPLLVRLSITTLSSVTRIARRNSKHHGYWKGLRRRQTVRRGIWGWGGQHLKNPLAR